MVEITFIRPHIVCVDYMKLGQNLQDLCTISIVLVTIDDALDFFASVSDLNLFPQLKLTRLGIVDEHEFDALPLYEVLNTRSQCVLQFIDRRDYLNLPYSLCHRCGKVPMRNISYEVCQCKH